MDDKLIIRPDLAIPLHELLITASRAGGPGGQHVNKTNSRITVRWHVAQSPSLSPEQKSRLLTKLAAQLTQDGELVVHNSASRSQQQNKTAALTNLATLVRKALHVPKKRMRTRVPKAAQEQRLAAKTRHSQIKQLRSKKISD